MGRDIVLARIKKNGIIAIVGGAFLMILFGLITIGVLTDNADDGMGMIILFGLFALLGIVFIIMGIRNIVRPEKTGYLKNNPQLLEMADQLYSHIIYEDQYVLISDKVLANKKQPTQMTWLWDVYLIYLHTTSTNFIPTGSEYIVENRMPKNRIAINVYAKGKRSKQELLNVLAQACPNARFGYSDEGLAYLQYMRNQDLRNIPNTPYYQGVPVQMQDNVQQ